MTGWSVPILRQLHEDARERRCRVRWLDLHLAEGLVRRSHVKSVEGVKGEENMEVVNGAQADLLALACALLSYQLGRGEVCLDLNNLPEHPFDYESGFNVGHAGAVRLLLSQLTADALRAVSCVGCPAGENSGQGASGEAVSGYGAPGTLQPLVLDGFRLYLHKYWRYEQQVKTALLERAQMVSSLLSAAQLRLFSQLFPRQTEVDWQAVSVAVALQRSLAIITGGPGTGKTTTVTKLLAVLTAQDDSMPHGVSASGEEIGCDPHQATRSNSAPVIKLVAPTGKAAARLTESIREAKQRLGFDTGRAERIPDQATTLHRLLGPLPNGASFKHNRDNPLHLDVLVLDEASMVDLPMMAKLLAALPAHARLILLGDPEQLASVEAGSVLADMVNEGREMGYSDALRATACDISGYTEAQLQSAWGPLVPTQSHMRDSLCRLRKSHRFQKGIGDVALAINRQDWAAFEAALSRAEDVSWQPLKAGQPQEAVQQAVDSYKPYRQLVRTGAAPVEILQAFEQCRVLAAVREGLHGVIALNKQIETLLFGRSGAWYAGRPILITRNDYNLNLFNGDIGITLECPERKQLRVYFVQPDGVRDIAISRLPEHETVFAMTIHKSQGSEFGHALIVLPEQDSDLLTKELLYTGITRAKRQCTIHASAEVLLATIARRTQRASGLRELLWG